MSEIPAIKTIKAEKLIATGLGFVGFKEVGNNAGQVVERFLKETGLPGGYAWCAAFIYHIGFYSQLDEATKKSGWPLPATASCLTLYETALKKGSLTNIPERGDIFLLYVPSEKRLAHTGIVLSSKTMPGSKYECRTLEGNTNLEGAREGTSVLIKNRTFNPNNGAKSDTFIRWTGMVDGLGATPGANV